MNNRTKQVVAALVRSALFVSALILPAIGSGFAQEPKQPVSQASPARPLLKYTAERHETAKLPFGGSTVIVGAPAGSVRIEGWQRSEVDVLAKIEIQAETEADLAQLAALNTFVLDSDPNTARVITTGTHDRAFMKRVTKNFPKKLLGLPWKIDYVIQVPALSDVDVNTGSGDLSLGGVEGAIVVNATESRASLALNGGHVRVTIARGALHLSVGSRSWRGAGITANLAQGELVAEFPPGLSADVSADVLRIGAVENSYPGLAPQERTTPSPKSVRLRAGAGGPPFLFTVGDGSVRLKQTGAQ